MLVCVLSHDTLHNRSHNHRMIFAMTLLEPKYRFKLIEERAEPPREIGPIQLGGSHLEPAAPNH